MILDFALIFGVAIAFVLFLLKGPGKLVSFVIMCFDDRVNMINIVCAFGALTFRFLSKASEIASIITPIVIFVSAVVVLLYNIAKLIKIHKEE